MTQEIEKLKRDISRLLDMNIQLSKDLHEKKDECAVLQAELARLRDDR